MIPACAGPAGPDLGAPIEVRPTSGTPVSGTDFACTDHPPTTMTPCDPFASQRHAIFFLAGAKPGVVELGLSRNSERVQADGAGTSAVLALQFEGEQLVRATARQSTYGELTEMRVLPRDGWIEPVASPAEDQRNAGRFSLTFDWGSISGTYDSVDAPPHRAR